MSGVDCSVPVDDYTESDVIDLLSEFDTDSQVKSFQKIQIYVLITILLLLLQLGYLLRPFAYKVFRLLSWVSYLLVPILISYILGLMGRSGGSLVTKFGADGGFDSKTVDTFRYLTCVWSVFLLFAYAGFDNLNAFSLDERHGRSKIMIQIGIQFYFLILIMYHLPPSINVVALSFAFIVLIFKFGGKLLALAHSAGATPRIKKDITRIINYSSRDDAAMVADPVTMEGFDYLVGPKYTKIEGGRIVDGVTVEKVFKSSGSLLAKGNEDLKDTSLSFALFWLLLGKFWSYPLYDHGDDDNKSLLRRAKAWKFVRHGLLAEEGEHERVFRVIEIELAFLRDYFHARYIFFYLNGFYWKLVSIIALPAMFWWFIRKAVDQPALDDLTSEGYEHLNLTQTANTIVISVIVFLEVIQLVVFLTSRWLKVTILCFYVNKMKSDNIGCLSNFFIEVFGSIFLGSSRSSNRTWWRKPWKREMSQYSLVQSCTTYLIKPAGYLKLHFISIMGVPFSKPGRKLDNPVKLSNEVKKAVVLCLQRNNTSLKLSNGAESLRRNGVMEMLPPWASKLNNDIKTILIWHIATSVCELQHTGTTTSVDAKSTNSDMKVATELSKYCAYLLFFAPSLLTVPSLVAENICDTVIEEARELFEPLPVFGRGGRVVDDEKYKKLMNLASIVNGDEEAGDNGSGKNILKSGAELGRELVKLVKEDNEKWRILAEFWAEMILYLAPSNNNELEHAGKLSLGGEFITQLWALLIHAGIYDRDDIDRAF